MKLYGKKAALERIGQFRRSGRFPHALLFCGEKGVGKTVLADYTAMLRLCGENGGEPCMSCKNCRRIEQHIHPDVVYPLREMEKYKVAELRDFITECFMAPNDGDLRIIVFEQLDTMSAACQNTLLKFIEEPLPFNSYIFTAESKAPILETILSRVTLVNVDGADRSECIAALAERGIPAEKAAELYGLYGGNIGKCIDGADGSDAELFKTAAEIANGLCGGREYDCAIRFSSVKTRDDAGQLLTLLSEIFTKASVISSGAKDDGAFSEQAKQMSQKMSIKIISKLYDAVGELISELDFNPNLQLFNAHCCAKLFSVIESGI